MCQRSIGVNNINLPFQCNKHANTFTHRYIEREIEKHTECQNLHLRCLYLSMSFIFKKRVTVRASEVQMKDRDRKGQRDEDFVALVFFSYTLACWRLETSPCWSQRLAP